MDETGMVPVMPRRMRTKVVRTVEELRLRCRVREWGPGIFLLLWLTGWTVGCVFLAHVALTKREVFTLLFAVPFWASWVFVFFLVLRAFFRVEELVLDSSGACYLRRVLVVVKSRRIPLEELKSAGCYSTIADSETGRRQAGLELETTGQPLRMLEGVASDELRWLVYQINEQIAGLRRQAGMVVGDAGGGAEAMAEGPSETAAGANGGAGLTEDAEDASLLILSAGPARPPADSQWKISESVTDLLFVRRGRLALAGLGGLVFINLFWNGIVSVFVAVLWGGGPKGQNNVPQGIGWWGMFVFLIPFEVIGLFMLLALVGTLAEPIHRTRWRFTSGGIECRNAWLGVGLRRMWTVEKLGRLDLRRESGNQSRSLKFRNASQPAETTYRIVFVTPDAKEMCAIKGLTEGEARWMAQAVLGHCAGWLG